MELITASSARERSQLASAQQPMIEGQASEVAAAFRKVRSASELGLFQMSGSLHEHVDWMEILGYTVSAPDTNGYCTASW